MQMQVIKWSLSYDMRTLKSMLKSMFRRCYGVTLNNQCSCVKRRRRLNDWLQEWAAGNHDAYNYWIKELSDPPFFIKSIQDLEKIAQSSRWQSTLDELSDRLAAELEKWKKDVFHENVTESKGL